MVSLMLVSLSGNERGKTYIFDKEAVLIGTDRACDLFIPGSENGDHAESKSAIFAEILRRPQGFQLHKREADNCAISINNNPLTKISTGNPVVLQDGDLLGFQKDSKMARYSLHVIEDKSIPPSTQNLNDKEHRFPEIDNVGHIHPLTATRFLKGLATSLWSEIPSKFKAFALSLTLLLVVSGIFSLAFILYEINQQWGSIKSLNIQRRHYEKQIEELKRQNQDLKQGWERERERINSAQTIRETYQRGVCLIQGIYTFVQPQTAAELRYLDNSFNNRALTDENGQFNVSFEGTGAVFYESFSGTGFLVDEGKLLTNRHVVHPWWQDEVDGLILAQGGKPQLVELYAYFPGLKTKFELKVDRFSSQHDVAICSFEQGDAAIPKLPLDSTSQAAAVGQAIIVLGYPTGIDGLIERLDDKLKGEIVRRAATLEERTQEVAKQGLIDPLTTQGHINGLNAGRIIHDAATTDGGSGSPIFNSDGKVIGINAAIIVNDHGGAVQGSNLGIPIRFAIDLMRAR
ncbi:MAG: trypsin-like peptidase domain-containing protein [Acidobacteriota bacterium]